MHDNMSLENEYLPYWWMDSVLNTPSSFSLQSFPLFQPPPPPPPPPPYVNLEANQTRSTNLTPVRVEIPAISSVPILEDDDKRKNRKRKCKELKMRSTCEKKRRSRIAERMKTLQELLPNSSYKLSAASVLEKAIEYIRTLQQEIGVHYFYQNHFLWSSPYFLDSSMAPTVEANSTWHPQLFHHQMPSFTPL